jgi:hypothetical protein
MAAEQLSQEQQDRIIRKIQQKWVGPHTCPICKTDKWTLTSHVTSPVRLNGLAGGMELGGQVFPTAMLMCNNCGYLLFFNLILMGVINPMGEMQDG